VPMSSEEIAGQEVVIAGSARRQRECHSRAGTSDGTGDALRAAVNARSCYGASTSKFVEDVLVSRRF